MDFANDFCHLNERLWILIAVNSFEVYATTLRMLDFFEIIILQF